MWPAPVCESIVRKSTTHFHRKRDVSPKRQRGTGPTSCLAFGSRRNGTCFARSLAVVDFAGPERRSAMALLRLGDRLFHPSADRRPPWSRQLGRGFAEVGQFLFWLFLAIVILLVVLGVAFFRK